MQYAIVNLFDRKVEKEVASEQEAVAHTIGMGGLVVVDRTEKRVYDGEYQTWSPLQDYCERFPPVAWIASM